MKDNNIEKVTRILQNKINSRKTWLDGFIDIHGNKVKEMNWYKDFEITVKLVTEDLEDVIKQLQEME